jgi:NAD(P)-dependent dehydrogenase (short-subunit alcohol dehydrogenase family)
MTDHGRNVLVTGASTGIGKTCALALAARGWRVFAGVRKERDAEALRNRAPQNLTPVFLDVTDSRAIKAAADSVREEVGMAGLGGLVNNAGIAVGGPLEYVPVSEIRRQMEVNVVGQIAVTQAFLPLLRQARGRLVLMGSVSGRCSLPLFGPYCASKFALEALADALRLELRHQGVQVSIIEPGATKTPIWDKSVSTNWVMMAAFPPGAEVLYGRMLERLDQIVHNTSKRAIPPARVAEVVIHALTARRPKARYLVGDMARIQLAMEAMPIWLRDSILAWHLLDARSCGRQALTSAAK